MTQTLCSRIGPKVECFGGTAARKPKLNTPREARTRHTQAHSASERTRVQNVQHVKERSKRRHLNARARVREVSSQDVEQRVDGWFALGGLSSRRLLSRYAVVPFAALSVRDEPTQASRRILTSFA